MRVLIFTNHFFPENFKVNDVAFELTRRGYSVTVVSGIPNYPHGRFYPGYGFFSRTRDSIKGVKVFRLPLIPRGNGGSIRLFLNYSSYLITSSLFSIYLAFKSERFDVVFVHETSPVTIGVPAVIYRALRQTPVLFWVLDLWPESVEAASNTRSRWLRWSLTSLVKSIYKRCDQILISSRGFAESIRDKGQAEEKLAYFPNWAEDVFLRQTFITPADMQLSEPKIPKGFLVMYAGNLGEAQDFPNLIAAAKVVDDAEIKYILVGGGRKEADIQRLVRENDLQERFFFPGNFPVDLMPYFFSKADVLFVSLRRDPIFSLTVPAKLQSYMAMGKPIIGVLDGEGGKIIQEAQCGITVEQENPLALAVGIKQMKALALSDRLELGKNGLMYYQKHFGKESNIERLENLIRTVKKKRSD